MKGLADNKERKWSIETHRCCGFHARQLIHCRCDVIVFPICFPVWGSHTQTWLLLLAEARRLPWGDQAIHNTWSVCPTNGKNRKFFKNNSVQKVKISQIITNALVNMNKTSKRKYTSNHKSVWSSIQKFLTGTKNTYFVKTVLTSASKMWSFSAYIPKPDRCITRTTG